MRKQCIEHAQSIQNSKNCHTTHSTILTARFICVCQQFRKSLRKPMELLDWYCLQPICPNNSANVKKAKLLYIKAIICQNAENYNPVSPHYSTDITRKVPSTRRACEILLRVQPVCVNHEVTISKISTLTHTHHFHYRYISCIN